MSICSADRSDETATRPVLVVEDDHEVRVLVRGILEDDGFEVLSATDGQQALSLAKERHPGLILLDLRLPIMDGWQFVELLKSDATLARLPVVIHSAVFDRPPPERVTAVLTKPVDADVLVDLARRYCTPLASRDRR